MNITGLMLAVLIASGVMLGLSAYYGDIITVYSPDNSTSTEEFQKFNDTFGYMNTKVSSIENHTSSWTSKGITDPSTWGDSALAFLDVVGIILNTPQIFISTINNMISMIHLPIPPWVLYVVFGAISLFVVMKIASIFLRRYGGDI
jgi:hypothetical protein